MAPHRLNVKLARQLCDLGFYVLRFDPEGIGDSEGELPEGLLIGDIWHKVQSGLFVSDTNIANEVFMNKYDLDQLILIGNCGGAISALLAGANDPRVDALILVDVPVLIWSSERSILESAVGDGEKLDHYFQEYIRRLFSFKSWYRLLTLKTDYRGMWYTLRMKLFKSIQVQNGERSEIKNIQKFIQKNKINPHFIESFEIFMARGKQLLFITGGNDPGHDSFQTLFEN